MSLCGQWSFESSHIHLPVMTAGHLVATRNSCTELVVPMEKQQPQRKEHLDGFIHEQKLRYGKGRRLGRGLLAASAVDAPGGLME
jgi:hypothetical protein